MNIDDEGPVGPVDVLAGGGATVPEERSERGPLAWMAANPVAANLLMAVVLLGGMLSAFSLKQEVFPEFSIDMVSVTVPYPGASPREVEQGIVLVIEEAVRAIDGVRRVNSVASEGMASVSIQLLLGADQDRVVSDVTNEVNRITTIPLDAEEPTISAATIRQPVISLIFAGDQDLRTLHGLAEQAREELLELPEVTQLDVSGVPPLEIAIEVRREDLEAYGLTLEQIAAQIRMASIDLPGGGVETFSGEVLVRVVDRRLTAEGFADVVIRGTAQRHELRLGDIATIVDGYEDTDQTIEFGGLPAVQLVVYRVGDQTPTEVATAVKDYTEGLRARVPANITLSTWSDDSEALEDRINLLFKNAVMGLALVLIVLTLFLSRQVAGWVALGIPISFLGAFLFMGPLDVSINMITLFALIITLGLVVDDAIIISENIYRASQQGMGRLEAAVKGAREMSMPVTFSVLTTMVAFAPLLFVPGVSGKIFRLIPIVVMGVLFFSLVESFYVLPAHLSHKLGRGWPAGARLMAPIDRLQAGVTRGLERFIETRYRPLLGTFLEQRYTTVAVAVAILLITIGAVVGGVIPFTFFPQIEGDVVTAAARLPFGASVDRTLAVRAELQTALDLAIEESGGSESIRGIISRVGQGPTQFGPSFGGGPALTGSHLVSLEASLVPQDQRDFSAAEFEEWWRAHVPALAELESLTIASAGGPSAGAAVDVQLSHLDEDVLAQASREMTNRLRDFPALINVDNSYAEGKPQLDFQLLPEAAGLGLTSTDVARAIRSSFFGAEALREQRGRNEIKVMVRLPEEQRASEQDIQDLIVNTPNGAVPVLYAAEFTRGRSPTRIMREDGRRTVNVTAELAQGVVSSRGVLAALQGSVFPELSSAFPGLSMDLVGQQREMQESFMSIGPNYLIALVVMFGLLAIPFRSYIQPLIVLSAVPFGIVGAVVGHLVMGYPLTMISVFGIIALSGVVVNDTLVLVHAINTHQRAGASIRDAVIEGSAGRLRPILLTSLTTFFGLLPIIFETSMQARFLIPMAISLGFGALFVTVIALLVVPALYVVVEDVRGMAWTGEGSPVPVGAEAVGGD